MILPEYLVEFEYIPRNTADNKLILIEDEIGTQNSLFTPNFSLKAYLSGEETEFLTGPNLQSTKENWNCLLD